MIVLDTTVLVYAKGADHQYRDPCRSLIRAIADGEIEATTTVEVIQEFVHVRARRRGREDAAELGNEYAALLAPLLPVTGNELGAGLRLFGSSESLGAFDAVLAATAVSIGATLVSADRAFDSVSGLSHLVPDHQEIAALLSKPPAQPPVGA